ncbi:MAG: hypothetical protein CMJ31_04700 [Phycisphaerae bacterium]|nr:hypothetical protein [Phycisphaerae bacterium]
MTPILLATISSIDGPVDRLGAPAWLHALWLVPLCAVLFAISSRARRRALARFAESGLLVITGARTLVARRWLRHVIVCAAVAALVVGLAQPRFNPTEHVAERRGRDVVFLVDVSRSMLARDLAPNRLERAKLWINDLITSLGGDRVGLVAFAGAATIECPLTLDRSFFRLTLNQLSPNSAPRGGTNIGDAIRKTVDSVFALRENEDGEEESDSTPTPNRYRDIILITDGEDQESFPVEAAKRAGDLGVRIIAIGIGSRDAPVPASDDVGGTLTYNGQTVRSSLDHETLSKIAAASRGNVFLNVGAGAIDLEDVYADLIATAEQTSVGSAAVVTYDEWFWAFLGLAFAFLAVEPLVPERGNA